MSYTGVVFSNRVGRTVDRDALEKKRIDDRVGFEARFQTAGNLIFQPQRGSSLFVDDKQRFNKDHDTNDRMIRQQQRSKMDNFYEKRKEKRIQIDQKRWNMYEKNDQKAEQKRLYHQKVLIENKRNSNGLPYNPITLNYEKSTQGEQLKKQDEDKTVRRYVRAQNIMDKNGQNFNLITGQPKEDIRQYVPEKLRERVVQKVADKKAAQVIKYQPNRDKYDYLDD